MDQPTYPVRIRLSSAPLHYLSALAILALDWAAFALNLALLSHLWAWWSAAVAVLAGLVVAAVEFRLAHSGPGLAGTKALVASSVVALPFPSAGTAVGTIALAWCLADWVQHRKCAHPAGDANCSQVRDWFVQP